MQREVRNVRSLLGVGDGESLVGSDAHARLKAELEEARELIQFNSNRNSKHFNRVLTLSTTGISSHSRAKFRDWADRQTGAGCYSQAALSSNDSKTRYIRLPYFR